MDGGVAGVGVGGGRRCPDVNGWGMLGIVRESFSFSLVDIYDFCWSCQCYI